MPTSHSDLAVEKADLRGVIQALRYSHDEGVREAWCGRRGQKFRNVHEGQMLEKGLEDVSVQGTEQERERQGRAVKLLVEFRRSVEMHSLKCVL